MMTLVRILLLLCSLGPVGCGDSNDLEQVAGQQSGAPAAVNLDNAQVLLSVTSGSLSGQGNDLQLEVEGVTELTLITEQGLETVSPDLIGQVVANGRVQAVLKVDDQPPVVYPLALSNPVYDAQNQTVRFSASPLNELPEWYALDQTVLYGEGPLEFNSASLSINGAEEGPVADEPPPLLGGAPGFQTDTVYYRYQESSGTAKLETRSVEIKTPLSISARNTVSGELRFDFPIEFVELSVRPTRNNLGFELTANAVDIVPPEIITVPYALTITTNTRPGTYGVPAFLVSGIVPLDVISLKVQVVP